MIFEYADSKERYDKFLAFHILLTIGHFKKEIKSYECKKEGIFIYFFKKRVTLFVTAWGEKSIALGLAVHSQDIFCSENLEIIHTISRIIDIFEYKAITVKQKEKK